MRLPNDGNYYLPYDIELVIMLPLEKGVGKFDTHKKLGTENQELGIKEDNILFL